MNRKRSGYYIGLLVGLLVLFPSAAKAQVNAEQVMMIGRNVLSMDDYMLSIQYFNLAIKAKPYLAEPYYYRGMAKLMLDDYQGAETDCSLALQRNRFITEAYRVRGFARARLGKDSLAVADFDKGLEYNPIDKYFLFYKAATQTSLKDYNGAEATFARLLKAFPRFDGAYSERARMYYLQGDTVSCLNDIEKATELNPNETNPYLFRASIRAARKEWEDAKSDMDKAIELMPKEAEFYVNRAYLRYNTDDYFGAMSDYNYAIELEPDNMAAVYNRALLRYEVHDLKKAAEDFSRVLQKEPDNFHARYSRGLIRLETGNNKGAIADFQAIAKVYPKFYPLYYGIAQARQASGDIRGAMASYQKGEDLVRKYVHNPSKNPLDRPTIQAGKTNSEGLKQKEDETEIDVMNRFNQLVTVSAGEVADGKISYSESIKGKVQDRDIKVETEPFFTLTVVAPETTLAGERKYFKELQELNERRYSDFMTYLTNRPPSLSEKDINDLFSRLEAYNIKIEKGSRLPVDYLNRALLNLAVKNYAPAINDFTKSIDVKDDFTVAFMGRAAARYSLAASMRKSGTNDASGATLTSAEQVRVLLMDAVDDLDKALNLNPSLTYAWFNRAAIYYDLGDLTSSLSCLNKAIELNPEFGEAFYNRGIVYLRMGKKQEGLNDLSKAGELGVTPSYNLLKRMKNE